MTEQDKSFDATKRKANIASETSEEKKIEQIAEEAAEKATNTEKRYDSEHTIFSN